MIGEWGPDRVDDLVALTSAALPGERLTGAELSACLWDDPGPAVVLGDERGAAAVAAVVRGNVGHLRLLAVAPGARRRGTGRDLLATAESWMVERGATELRVGAEVPYYLWPGVPIEATEALALLETSGYDDAGAVLDMVCPTDLVAPPPAGVEVRVVDDGAAVGALVDRVWPWWRDEVDRAVAQGGCLGAFLADGTAVGFGCHSVSRAGWIGPIGTDPAAGRGGIGAAVMAGLCAELRSRGHQEAEICWVGPIAFYAKACGARMSRAFQTRVKRRI